MSGAAMSKAFFAIGNLRLAISIRPLKILFVITEDQYFHSHRLPLAVAVQQAGYDAVVATRLSSFCYKEDIEQAGIRIVPLQHMKRSSLNPFRELAALAELLSIYWRERPDLVHQVALKPHHLWFIGSTVSRYSHKGECTGRVGLCIFLTKASSPYTEARFFQVFFGLCSMTGITS